MADSTNTQAKKPVRRRTRRSTLRPMEFLYQQIYDTNSNVVLGYDAILQINDRKLGTLTYDRISGIADRNNLSHRVGKWQITEACEMMVRKAEAGKSVHRVFITLSAKYVARAKFCAEFAEILAKYEVDPTRFCIQIPEQEFAAGSAELYANVKTLRDADVKVAISEFGVESTSMLKLSDAGVDYIKLDPAFAEGVDSSERIADVTESVIDLADKLGFLVIADGIDTKEQLQAFTRMRCFLLEGMHFSSPEREDEAIH